MLVLALSLSALLVGVPSSEATSRPSAAMAVARSATVTNGQNPSGPEAGVASETRLASEILRQAAEDYRLLDGVTVTIGTTPRGEEAVAYYTEDRIVISRTHTVSIEKILAHEIWHIIDWRDNGVLDWHESVPPYNASTYLSGNL